MARRLPILCLLLTVAAGSAVAQTPYRAPRFSYRLQTQKIYLHKSVLDIDLFFAEPAPRDPGEDFFDFNYPPPAPAEIVAGYRSWRLTHDELGREHGTPFSYALFNNTVASERARQHQRQVEENEGLISDIEIDWLATKLKISGRKLFVLGYTAKNYENPPDPTLEGGQHDFSMDQETQIRVEGTIAQRITVNVDYDDTRENDARNEISLIYEGEDDEFIKRGELGDVMLSVPSTRFVSYSAKSLFGAKVEGGLGEWFNFTLIGSREKGVTEEEEFTGTGQLQRDDIRDTDYTENLYYRVDTNPNHFQNTETPIQIAEAADGSALVDIWVYESGQQHESGVDYYAVEAGYYDDEASDDPTVPPTPTGETYSAEFWELLEPVNDYTVNKYTGRIDFKTTRQDYEYIAVSYSVALQSSPQNPLYTVGSGGLPNPKLIKIGQTSDGLDEYMHQNIYYLGATGIELDSDFVLVIQDLQDRTNDAGDIDDDGDTDEPLVRALGLTRTPDGSDDSIDPAHLNTDKGLLIFPERYPFQKEGEEGTDEDAYDSSYGNRNHRYDIHIEFHAASTTRFLRPNIIPGSEEVVLNGRRLVRDVDYIIDYDSGYIEFLVSGADASDADLKITYEYQPLFGDTGKTLAGGRLEFTPLEFLTLGGTYIGEWTDKPADEEDIPELMAIPSAHQVVDADAQLDLDSDFMTSLVSFLPGVDENSKSNLLVEGEYAYSYYDPNRVGRSHVDDLESAHQTISLPLDGREWGPSSPPSYGGAAYLQENRELIDVDDTSWVQSTIDPDWQDDVVTVLTLEDLPGSAGGWDSIARIVAANGLDMGEKNLQYLELYLYREGTFNGGVLHFDIGLINEDADGDYTGDGSFVGYDSEDQGSEEGWQGYGYDPGELDGRLNYDEDVGWEFNNGHLEETIGAGDGILNTEDLDYNLQLDTESSHYGYAVPLDELPPEYIGRDLGNGWVALRIPLELDAPRPGDYNPPANKVIKTLRIWIEADGDEAFSPASTLYIYGLQLKGVKWKATTLEPDNPANSIEAGTIDSDTSGEYEPLEPRTDDDGYPIREQALDVHYRVAAWEDYGYDGVRGDRNLEVGPTAAGGGATSLSASPRRAADGVAPDPGENDGILNTEDLNHNGILDEGEDIGWAGYDPAETGAGNGVLDSEDEIIVLTEEEFLDSRDFTSHRELSISFYNRNPERSAADLFTFRFGSDADNYYEVRCALGEMGAGWQKLEIAFDELVALRQAYEALDPDERPLVYREGNLAVTGSPSLVRVYWMAVGVTTTEPMPPRFGFGDEGGRMWVNNIDLHEAQLREGQAARGRVSLDFGDVLRLDGTYTKIEGDFQSIGLSRTGITREDWGASGTLELGAFMPNDWKVGLPLSASYTRADTYVENIAAYEGSLDDLGRTTSDTINASLAFNRVSLPRLSFKYTDYKGYNENYGRNDHDVTYGVNLDYSLLQGFFLLPTKIDGRYLYSTDQTTYEEQTGRVDSFTGSHELTSSITWQFARGLSFTPAYSFKDSRDLLRDEPTSFTQTGRVGLSYNRFRLLQPSLDYSTTYNERYTPGSTYYPESWDVGISNSFSASLPTSPGLLIEDYFGSWTASFNYSLRRSSSYDDVESLPPAEYIWGYDTIWHDGGEATSASRGYSYSASTRLRPLEFFRASSNTDLHDLDFILAQLKYSFSTDLSESYGSSSETWTETWPAGDLTLTTTKYFPIFSDLLQQSIFKAGFQKTTTKWIGVSLTRTWSPSFSWRATWSDTFSTTADYTESSTITDEEASDYGFGGAHRVTNSYNPSASLTYNLELPGTFTVPFLGGDVPLRNELRLNARYSYKLTNGNEESGTDETKRSTVSLSGAYYLTTNIYADLTLTYEDFVNETSVGYNYTSFDVKLSLEIKF